MDIDGRRELAERVARVAGKKAKAFLARPEKLQITEKSCSQDLVTAADKAAEMYLRRAIAKDYPADGILGEEAGATRGTSGFDWVIDPIDGTMAFLVGQQNWTVSVAVLFNGEPMIGVVFAPMLREIFVGQAGRGATMNAKPITINHEWTICSTAIGYGASARADPVQAGIFVTRLYQEGGVMFRVGSGALMLAYVAANRLAGYYDPSFFCWDCMAGIVVIREAGGLAEFTGSLHEPGSIWAGNLTVHSHLKRLSEGHVE
ncbi:MAG: inositol monophosphatase [Rhizobium sp.]|nr:inositol monophosphatase [Rhizobium sp.]